MYMMCKILADSLVQRKVDCRQARDLPLLVTVVISLGVLECLNPYSPVDELKHPMKAVDPKPM